MLDPRCCADMELHRCFVSLSIYEFSRHGTFVVDCCPKDHHRFIDGANVKDGRRKRAAFFDHGERYAIYRVNIE